MNDDACIAEILEYWFSQLDENGVCPPAQQQLWFKSSTSIDEEIRDRFGYLVEAALAGKLDHWTELECGLMALVLLLDQFTRNILRGSPQAFAGDEQALALVKQAVSAGRDRLEPTIHRVFLYIPYEHAEDLTVQEQGIAQFDQLLLDCPASVCEQVRGFRQYSLAHRDVIAKFGRFPHRNVILQRASSEQELEHLQTHGGF
jgi:uncharacterized protein (DUF924 family)